MDVPDQDTNKPKGIKKLIAPPSGARKLQNPPAKEKPKEEENQDNGIADLLEF